MDANSNDFELQVLARNRLDISSLATPADSVTPSLARGPSAHSVDTEVGDESVSQDTERNTAHAESNSETPKIEPHGRLRSRVLKKASRLRKWEFYERLCTFPILCVALLTVFFGYVTLNYLYYQSVAIFREDCMAMRVRTST